MAKFHEIDMVGPINIERVSTLPTWTSNDIGRMVYVTSEEKKYFGGNNGWKFDGGIEEIYLEQQNSDPDVEDGQSVIWHSDGSDSGDDGDIMIKIKDSNGVSKTTTLVNFSGI